MPAPPVTTRTQRPSTGNVTSIGEDGESELGGDGGLRQLELDGQRLVIGRGH